MNPVHTSRWTRAGSGFSLSWAGREWRLSFDKPNPGLCWEIGSDPIKLLSLGALVRTGRVDLAAFTSETLVELEPHRGALQATFVPAGWGGLTVRACWRPIPLGEGMDLEVQLSAATVGELDSVVVNVLSRHGDMTGGRRLEPPIPDGQDTLLPAETLEPPARSVSHNPPPSARESQETRHPLPGPRLLVPMGTLPGWHYVEMVRPGDQVSRAQEESGQGDEERGMPGVTRYALFGHDLEKGVIVRARVRGCWFNSNAPDRAALVMYQDFLREPLSLSP